MPEAVFEHVVEQLDESLLLNRKLCKRLVKRIGLGNLKAGKVMGNNLSSGPAKPRQWRGRY
jgi:hypothetical protein